MRGLSSNDGNTNQRPPMQLQVPSLGHRNLKLPPNLRNDRSNESALLLKRMHIPKKQVNLKNPSEHASPPLARVLAETW